MILNPSSILVEISPEAVLGRLLGDAPVRHHEIDGYKYDIRKLKTFAVHGCTCTICGSVGTRMVATKTKNGISLNLYTLKRGRWTMMNRDHIVPASLGGNNNVWNLRPTCSDCNSRRGNNVTREEERTAKFNSKCEKAYKALRKKGFLTFKVSIKLAPWVARIPFNLGLTFIENLPHLRIK